MVTPSVRATARLTTNSRLVVTSNGVVAGLAPLSTLSMMMRHPRIAVRERRATGQHSARGRGTAPEHGRDPVCRRHLGDAPSMAEWHRHLQDHQCLGLLRSHRTERAIEVRFGTPQLQDLGRDLERGGGGDVRTLDRHEAGRVGAGYVRVAQEGDTRQRRKDLAQDRQLQRGQPGVVIGDPGDVGAGMLERGGIAERDRIRDEIRDDGDRCIAPAQPSSGDHHRPR